MINQQSLLSACQSMVLGLLSAYQSMVFVFLSSFFVYACCSSQATYSGQDMQNTCMAQYDFGIATMADSMTQQAGMEMAPSSTQTDNQNQQFPSCHMPIFTGLDSTSVNGSCRFHLDACGTDEIAYLNDFRCLAKGLGACCIPKTLVSLRAMSDESNLAQVSDCVSVNGFCVQTQENPCQGAVDLYHRVNGLCFGNAVTCCVPN